MTLQRTTDFAPFAQRIKASGAQAVYVFLPGGPPNLGFVKAYNENGLKAAGVEFLGTAETDEFDLQKFGDSALGLTTAFHYSAAHDSPANKTFAAAVTKVNKDAVLNYATVGLLRLIADALDHIHRRGIVHGDGAGRLRAELQYGDIDEILSTGLHAFLSQFLERVGTLGVGISRDFLVPVAA